VRKARPRIETKTSRTAQYTCLSRAVSYRERREAYKGPDQIAYRLIPGVIRLLLHLPGATKFFGRFGAPRGIYEYVIARTRFIDARFEKALKEGFRQAVIFGAGFDSRAQRFDRLNRGTRIFELDTSIIQEEKRKALEDRGIATPRSLVFVALNFNQESLAGKLAQAGYEAGQRTFFLLEGVTMYLTPEAVGRTFRFLQETAGPSSRVVFDFVWAGLAGQEDRYYGAGDILKRVNKAGETWNFFLEEDGVGKFLEEYGFGLEELCDARELEKRYFSDPGGRVLARMNGTHGLAAGIKTG